MPDMNEDTRATTPKIIRVQFNDQSANTPIIGFAITNANLLNIEIVESTVALFCEGIYLFI